MPCPTPRTFKGYVVSCGVCPHCLNMKRWLYRSRILLEMSEAQKTWFVTLTLRRKMSDEVGYKIVQRWLKRVRKKMKGESLRYAAIAEHGSQATRRLHYHVVVHGPCSLTERTLRRSWRGGISEATLVSAGNAEAVARYSSKMSSYVVKGLGVSRFRFSLGYGSKVIQSVLSSPMLKAVSDAFPFSKVSAVRVHGSRVHPGLVHFNSTPVPVYADDPDLLAEIEDTRREQRYARAIEDRRARQLFSKPRPLNVFDY